MSGPDAAQAAAEPLSVLRVRLKRLRRERGEPSLREIAAQTHHAISHATVRAILTGNSLPRWGQIEVVVEALKGDVEEFRDLWVTARDKQDEAGEESSEERILEVKPWDNLPETMPELEAARTTVDEEIAQKRQHETDLARELFDTREERANRDDEIRRLQSRAAVDDARRQYLEGEISRLETARDRFSKRIQELEAALAVVHEDLAQLAREKAELADRYKDLGEFSRS